MPERTPLIQVHVLRRIVLGKNVYVTGKDMPVDMWLKLAESTRQAFIHGGYVRVVELSDQD
jgi:hypothetical protein